MTFIKEGKCTKNHIRYIDGIGWLNYILGLDIFLRVLICLYSCLRLLIDIPVMCISLA